MMDIKKEYELMKQSKEYSQIGNKYLVNVFFILNADDTISQPIQFGFYDTELDKITTITKSEDGYVLSDAQEIAKTGKRVLHELDLDALSVDFADVDRITVSETERECAGYAIVRKMYLLQKNEVTLFTNTVATELGLIMTVQIDATTGEILKSSKFNVRDLIRK